MSRTLTRLAATAGVLALAAGLAGCQTAADAGSDYVTDGKLTIATGEPAYYPYVIDDAPESGEGFEAAVAYAIAEELGFAAEDVVWVRTGFDEAIAPGPKAFDFNLQQYTITPERAESVDFSSPYYAADQAVITIEGSPAAEATSIADLQGLLIGAATGTTSLAAVEQIIQPTAGAQVFNSNDDAKLALESGQVDAIVVDVPTAFYITGVELDGGVIVGSLPEIEGATDEWGVLLAKDSPLTDAVTAAIDALRENGTLDALIAEWLGADQGVAELQ
ncbi:ABC transporter substrate-binding protein [Pseudolysinimonas sp.]|uniref:ABC transporter substrate-binding protein n=1 Tax=Pseudolysinimonas sp. TaxID=2680009 RepID=UPI00286C2EF7|nr:ABC transporter substrate-binding protein [Pseudolysinimonas sp.]